MLAVLSLCCFAISSYAQTQNWDTLPWKAHADYQMQNLNKSFIATNILYDRMFPLANVDEYKGLPYNTNTDTTHPDHLMQAYYEMYNSAYNTTSMMPPDRYCLQFQIYFSLFLHYREECKRRFVDGCLPSVALACPGLFYTASAKLYREQCTTSTSLVVSFLLL